MYILSSYADEDLKNILRYTINEWGKRQTRRYNFMIRDSLGWLSQNPFTIESKKRFDLHPGCYFYHVGKHFIVYRFLNDRLEIARILHESMDFKNQLKPLHFKFE